MMKNHVFFRPLIGAMLLLFLAACGKEDISKETDGPYASGVFAINEGAFPNAGTVSFYDRQSKTMTNNLFETVNGGASLGSVVQSMASSNNRLYVVANGNNRVTVVNPATFKYIDTLKGLIYPRYVQPYTTKKIFISEWGQDGVNGAICVYNLDSNKVLKRISTKGFGADKMLLVGDRLYAINNSGFSYPTFDSTLVIVNTIADSVFLRLNLGASNPSGLVQDVNSYIWVSTVGNYTSEGGMLFRIDPTSNKVDKTFTFSKSVSNLITNANKTKIYFISNNKVWVKDTQTADAAPVELITNSNFQFIYGLGIDSKTGYLYIGDSRGKAQSKVFIYDLTTQTIVDTEDAGEFTNGFFFQ